MIIQTDICIIIQIENLQDFFNERFHFYFVIGVYLHFTSAEVSHLTQKRRRYDHNNINKWR